MKYYFGNVPAEDVEAFGAEDLFEHEGSYYYNCVEFGTNPGGVEDFMISDTCGRSIPISTEMIPGLSRVLLDIRMAMNTFQEAEELEQDVYDPEVVVVFE